MPRGLHWKPTSPHIFFSWRDADGRQHQKSTEKTDPAEALLFKMTFLKQQAEKEEEEGDVEPEFPEYGKFPLAQVAKLYFDWKLASNAKGTVKREERMFKSVLKFFGPNRRVKSITLPRIRRYQKVRSKHISLTTGGPVTGRTINYEMQLLRAVMKYAGCWTPELNTNYVPLRQIKKRKGKTATSEQLMTLIAAARENDPWMLAMYCMAVAVGTGCRSCEIKNLRLEDIQLESGRIKIAREIAKNRHEREPILLSLAEWGLRELLMRAKELGATEPEHYLLPLNVRKSRILAKQTDQKWDVTRPMTTWVKSWRSLVEHCGMKGFRFHDLRHTFRTLGAEAGVPLEVMMAQLGHLDRDTSLEYVHIQEGALQKAKAMMEREQATVLAAAQGHRAVASFQIRQDLITLN